MSRATTWWSQFNAAGEGWLPLVALTSSAWLFTSMADGAPEDVPPAPPATADLRCDAPAAPAAATAAASPLPCPPSAARPPR